MARLNVRAVQDRMVRRNLLFKHQLASHLGISYQRLSDMLVAGEDEVEEVLVDRLCDVLACSREQIVRPPPM